MAGVADWSASMMKSCPASLCTWMTWTFPAGRDELDDDADATMPRVVAAATVAARSVLGMVMRGKV